MLIEILNIGLDRELLDASGENEALRRQLFYVNHIPARITHIVKARKGVDPDTIIAGHANLEIRPCPVRHWSEFVFRAYFEGAGVLRQRPVHLIQAQEPFLSGMAAMALSHRYRIPYIVGAFSDEVDNPVWLSERLLNRVANRIAKTVFRRAAAIRADSQAVAAHLKGLGFSQVSHVPFLITNADRLAAPSAAAAATRSTILGDSPGPLLLTVSRLEAEKNVSLLLKAFAIFRKTGNGARLAVIGDGSLRADLAAEAEKIAPGAVRWLGRLPNAELGAWYQAADLFVLSSDRESSARVLTESLLAGTPVLTTDTAGAREVVEDRVSGRVVPVGDPEAMASVMAELFQRPAALPDMGGQGRERMLAVVSGRAVAARLAELYRAVISPGRS